MTSRGTIIFAHNNDEIDHAKLALCAALLVKKNLREKTTCLMADEGTISWLQQSQDEKLLKQAFDHIVEVPLSDKGETVTLYDTPWTARTVPWRVQSRLEAYDLSPFDETLLIDNDYLVMNNRLDLLWGSYDDYAMTTRGLTLENREYTPEEQWLDPSTIRRYRTTALWFRKSPAAEALFDLARHVHNNWEHYQNVYQFMGDVFRNDYAFSVAAHILSGSTGELAPDLPIPLLSSPEYDDMIDVTERGGLRFFVNDREETWRFRIDTIEKRNVHVMNKASLVRNVDKLIRYATGDT